MPGITLDESEKKIAIIDQNNNKVIMTPSGIRVESPRQIEIIAGSVLSLRAGTSFTIKAPSISIKADADLDIQGATVKLAAQGITSCRRNHHRSGCSDSINRQFTSFGCFRFLCLCWSAGFNSPGFYYSVHWRKAGCKAR